MIPISKGCCEDKEPRCVKGAVSCHDVAFGAGLSWHRKVCNIF